MTGDQTIEYKATWRDECLKWICGFANAQGGVLEIGKDDRGRVVGVADAAKLLEDLPNKIRDILGIVPEVDRLTENGKDYLRITVQPYPNPISYKGQYHVRSGSTKQELKGSALDHFLLGKYGRRWDGVPLPGVKPSDLDASLLERFRRRAVQSRRLNAEDLPTDDTALLDMLRLTEGNYLKRAAVLLFHPDPERFITGAFVKIGYFLNDAEIRYQDEVHGDLFTQVDQTVRTLVTKYFQALISYEGIYRIETYPVPEPALREAVVNAVAHKDYASCTPIQIRVYDDRILIWNSGTLPDNWTAERLKAKHPSKPFNPDVANVFFRAGTIEAWGRGIERMCADCAAHGVPEPVLLCEPDGMWVEFANRTVKSDETIPKTRKITGAKPAKLGQGRAHEAHEAHEAHVEGQVQIGAVELVMLRICAREPASSKELLAATGYSARTGHFKRSLEKLIHEDLIMMTIPDKPRSRQQKYRLSEKGKSLLAATAFGGTDL
jgi:ATP-dependent DNA helicase RecG